MFDVEEYIASGTIEACLLGMATPEEMAEMNRLAALHPKVAAELDAVRKSLDVLHSAAANSFSTPPPPALRAKVLAAAFSEFPEQSPSPEPVTRIPSTNKLPWAFALAGLIASIALSIFLFQASSQKAAARKKAESLQQQVDILGRTVERGKEREQVLVHERDSVWMACANKIELKGLPLEPQARAFVYFDGRSGEVMAEVEMLPETPSGMGYQLWAIVKGQPVDLGMLHMQGKSMQVATMKKVMEAEAFAVTLEQQQGSPSPTMEMMYVFGKV